MTLDDTRHERTGPVQTLAIPEPQLPPLPRGAPAGALWCLDCLNDRRRLARLGLSVTGQETFSVTLDDVCPYCSSPRSTSTGQPKTSHQQRTPRAAALLASERHR